MVEINANKDKFERHGGAYDRGMADSYYCRTPNPHFYVGGTKMSPIVTEENMTADEIASYYSGFEYNEELGNHKDWG